MRVAECESVSGSFGIGSGVKQGSIPFLFIVGEVGDFKVRIDGGFGDLPVKLNFSECEIVQFARQRGQVMISYLPFVPRSRSQHTRTSDEKITASKENNKTKAHLNITTCQEVC